MKTKTYKIGEKTFKIKKINFVYRAVSGNLPKEITSYVRAALNGEKEKTNVDMFELIGDMYELFNDIMIEPLPTEELFDNMSQNELMKLFTMILYDVQTEEQQKETKKEIENSKNS